MGAAAKRRWLRFGLGGLLLFVLAAAFCVHLTLTLRTLRQRENAHRLYPIVATYSNVGEEAKPPLFWRLFGAQTTHVVSLRVEATEADVASVRRLFPEAKVVVLKED